MGMDTVSESNMDWSRSREDFLSQVNVCIQQDQLMKVHDAICNNEIDRTVLESSCMDLVSSLTNHIVERNNFNTVAATQCCEVFHSLAKVCNAKEMVLAFCEQIEAVIDNRIFYILLEPLSTALDHVHPPTPKILDQSLETIYGYLIAEPLPRHLDTKSKKRLREIDNFTELLTRCVMFVEHFVGVYKSRQSRGEELRNNDERIILQNCCLGMLANPLVNLDVSEMCVVEECVSVDTDDGMTPAQSTRTAWREAADKLMKMLYDVQCHYTEVMRFGQSLNTTQTKTDKNRNSLSHQRHRARSRADDSESGTDSSCCDSGDEDESMNHESFKKQEEDLGRACLAYLLFSERLHDDNLPQIYSPVHVFSSTLYYTNLLITDINPSLIHKGVYLGLSLLVKLSDHSILHETLELQAYRDFPELLINTMLRCPDKQLRTKSLQLFSVFISKLEGMGRYKLFKLLIVKCKHSGVIGMLIGKVKDEIHNALNSESSTISNKHQMFLGSSAYSLLVQIFKLPKGSEADILEESDRIMSALNLLRYLLIRDTSNRTMIWSLLPKCEAGLLSPLRTALNMSTVHYKQEIDKNHKKLRQSRVVLQKNTDVDVVDPTTLKQQHIMLQNALHMFDMMESVLGRISELTSVPYLTNNK